MLGTYLLVGGAMVLAVNLTTWAAFRWDKYCAQRNRRRVRERTLLGLAACGGIIGALLGMYFHSQRHKTSDQAFLRWMYVIITGYAAGVVLVGWLLLRPR